MTLNSTCNAVSLLVVKARLVASQFVSIFCAKSFEHVVRGSFCAFQDMGKVDACPYGMLYSELQSILTFRGGSTII